MLASWGLPPGNAYDSNGCPYPMLDGYGIIAATSQSGQEAKLASNEWASDVPIPWALVTSRTNDCLSKAAAEPPVSQGNTQPAHNSRWQANRQANNSRWHSGQIAEFGRKAKWQEALGLLSLVERPKVAAYNADGPCQGQITAKWGYRRIA